MTSRLERLHPILRRAVEAGLMTEGEALDVDAYTDRLATEVTSGEKTSDEAGDEAARVATRDALARRARRQPAAATEVSVSDAAGGETRRDQ